MKSYVRYAVKIINQADVRTHQVQNCIQNTHAHTFVSADKFIDTHGAVEVAVGSAVASPSSQVCW